MIKKYIKNGKLKVRVKPGAKETKITGFANGFLEIRLNAVPEKGKANQELLKFLKKELGIKARIMRGLKSREKTLEII